VFRASSGGAPGLRFATTARAGTPLITAFDDVFGCRGARGGATLVNVMPDTRPPKGTCLVDPFHAEPCEAEQSCFSDYDDGNWTTDERAYRAAEKLANGKIRDWKKAVAAGERMFPDPGGFRVVVTNASIAGGPSGLEGFVATLEVSQDELGGVQRGDVSKDTLVALELGPLAPFETVELWVPRTEGGLGLHAALVAEHEAGARERLAKIENLQALPYGQDLATMEDFDGCTACD